MSQKVNNLQEFGEALAETNDLYACAAKRYFEYFTGIGVSLADLRSPENDIDLTSEQMTQRDFVISLGKKLKKTQSLPELIEEIISSSFYQEVYGE